MQLPPDHPQRVELNDEVHARPPEALVAPLRLSLLAIINEPPQRERELEHVCALAERFGARPPAAGATHCSVDLGPFRLRWERHTEFSRYLFIAPGASDDPFVAPAIAAVPEDWVAGLSGQTIVAAHAALVPAAPVALDHEDIAARLFAGNNLVGSTIAGGAGVALTDFRIGPDGFGRFYVIDRGMTPRQCGRMLQRLLEIETYRIMALLAFPVARQLGPFLTESERELAQITAALARADEKDEALLLDRLTALEAQIESRESQHAYRFDAADAYYDLVRRRIAELREDRIQGLQTFLEFTERRLAPAISTCRAVAQRLRSLSERVARVTQLLSTRVDITRERQNQAVLESMNRRAKLQLRLQQTVEGLSVAAVTYYISGLAGYLAKGLKAGGVPVEPDIVVAVTIPIVAMLAALTVRRIRRVVARSE
jgi:uncharacterized membrane-anchored protein